MTKFAVIVFCMVVAAVKTDELEDAQNKFMALQQECMKETGVTNDMLTRAMEGDFPDNPEFKEQLVCVGKKENIISADGIYNLNVLKEKMLPFINDETKIDSILNSCYKPKASIQDTSFDMAKCAYAKYYTELV